MKRSLAVLLTVALVVGAVGPATAQSDDGGILSGMVAEDGEEDPLWATIGDWYLGAENTYQKWQDRVMMAVPFIGDESVENATTYANAVESTLEANNASIRAYVNERVEPRSIDAVRVFFHDLDGGNVTRYVVADASPDGWTSGPAMLTTAEFEATNYTVDHWVSLDWFASKYADEELQTFVDDRVNADENVSMLRRANLLRKYAGSIKSSAWGDESPAFEEGN